MPYVWCYGTASLAPGVCVLWAPMDTIQRSCMQLTDLEAEVKGASRTQQGVTPPTVTAST